MLATFQRVLDDHISSGPPAEQAIMTGVQAARNRSAGARLDTVGAQGSSNAGRGLDDVAPVAWHRICPASVYALSVGIARHLVELECCLL